MKTLEQTEIIKEIQEGNNVTVTAIPGAGKTTTIRFACEEIKDKRILILTYNRHIRDEVKNKLEEYKDVDVHTFHSFASKLNGKIINDDYEMYLFLSNTDKEVSCIYDIIFVDEAQDITEEYVNLINYTLKNNKVEKCQLIFLGDPRQNIYSFSGSSVKYLYEPEKYFDQHDFKKMFLTKSFRLTNTMSEFINNNFNKEKRFTDIVPKNEDKAEPVKFLEFVKVQEIADIIELKIKQYGIENISVLLPSTSKKLAKTLINKLSFEEYSLHISESIDEVNPDFLKNKLSLSTFHRNKGLEKKCIIVTNFDEDYYKYYNKEGSFNNNALFVALTRASEELILFKNKYSNTIPDLIEDVVEKQISDNVVYTCSDDWKIKRRRVEQNNNSYFPIYSVTELIKFLSTSYIKDILEKITIEENNISYMRVKRVEEFGNYKEDVSYIYGTAVSVIFDYMSSGVIKKMDMIEEDIKNKTVPKDLYYQRAAVLKLGGKIVNIYKKRFFNAKNRKMTIIKCRKSLFYIINFIHCWFNSFYLMNQIKNYEWVNKNFIEHIINYSANVDGAEFENYYYEEFNVNSVEKSENTTIEKSLKVGVKGFVDAIKDKTLYEFKYCSRDSLEHVIQSICYSSLASNDHVDINEIKIVNFYTGVEKHIKFNDNCKNFLRELLDKKFNQTL